MTGKTHFVIGANTAWLAFIFMPQSAWFFGLMLAGGFVALLPDLDNKHAEIHQLTKGLLRLLLIDKLRHRSLLHSLIIMPVVAVASYFTFKFYPMLPWIITLGYASHPFIDGFNPQGCEYFYPSSKNFRLIPEFLCVKTGGWVDHILFGLGVLAFGLFVAVYFGLIQIQLVGF